MLWAGGPWVSARRALGFSQELFDPSGGASDKETAAAALGSMTAQMRTSRPC
jgi:hypothetical protein